MANAKQLAHLGLKVGIGFILFTFLLISTRTNGFQLTFMLGTFLVTISLGWLSLSSAIREGIKCSK